jgi:signal transduction histidine kinase
MGRTANPCDDEPVRLPLSRRSNAAPAAATPVSARPLLPPVGPPVTAHVGTAAPRAGRSARLYRTSNGRVVAGVCTGLSQHIGLDVWTIRSIFVLLAFMNGSGVLAYVALWALVPQAGEFDEEQAAPEPESSWRLGPLLAFGAAALGLLLLAARAGLGAAGGFTIPLVLLGLGVAVLWRVADDAQRERWRAAATATGTGSRAWIRLAIGIFLASIGFGALIAVNGGFVAALYGVGAVAVVLLGVAAISGPWLYRLSREASDERRERIRSQERAELAAHVHDSVLQTLTLVQRAADDPREVVRLARAEERALRGWLYAPERAAAGTFSPSLERIAAEVEEMHGGTVDAVIVGDTDVDEALAATLQAAREAIVNAVKYASDDGPVSVYAEVGERDVSIFVRDRGPGFDVAAVPADRHGVRESIVGRMERHGGRAAVRSDSDGTEIELEMPRETS